MRRPGPRGLSPSPVLSRLILVMTALAGCEAPPDLPPEQILQDSLGLTLQDRVQVVEVRHARGGEIADPDSVALRPGEWVDFRTGDAHPRVVSFLLDSLPPEARDLLQRRGVTVSPPLAAASVHWPVPFDSAPPGRYPYRVEGSGEPGAGVVVVLPPR